ncbi:TPA: membrane protein insertion efficiency factor YidD, partial [Listeria monocytogenes]|nr:membrane protein insertion efficiency factor YidD [Listeria monocytogenes]
MKKILIGGIRLYQKYISRFTPATCRFYPTCSAYGIEAIQTHGALKGSYLAIRRISK